MKENYKINLLQPKDVSKVIDIVKASFERTYLIPSIYRGKGIENFISNEIENPFSPYRYFVLFETNVIVGFAEYKIFESTSTAFLNIIAVNNDCKNKGIGKKLFEYTKNYFGERGFESLALDVYESNTVAFNWYKGFGFNQTNSTAFYEIEIERKKQESAKIYIQNYPQYKALQNKYGFYFLDIVVGNESIRLGTIDKDLIIRENYSPSLRLNLPYLLAKFEFEKIYFIGNDSHTEFRIIDKIIRMELNIKL